MIRLSLRWGALFLALGLLVDAPAAQDTGNRQALSYTLLAREGRRPLAATQIGGNDMVALADLAAIFQLTVQEDSLGITIGDKGKRIVLSRGQGLASVEGRLISLPGPAVRDARGWLVPVEFISRALALVHETRLELRKPARLVLVGDVRVPRVVARLDLPASQARVAIDAAPRTPYGVTQDGGRILVRFESVDALDVSIPAIEPGPLVAAMQVIEPGTIALVVGPRFGSYRPSDAGSDAAMTRLQIDLLPAGADSSASAAPATPGPTPPPAPVLETGPVPVIRTIVIDPGHGGEDTGSKGASGGLEKTVTLGVARRLKAAIEGRLGVRVVLTREGDQMVRLDERAAIANNNKADIFLSLHANASRQPSVAGAEVFYLSIDEYGEEARRLAATEPVVLPVFGGGGRPIDVIQWDMAQAPHLERSAVLARFVEERLRGRVAMSPRALQQAPFRVLVGANMPAVLIEMGFMTNSEQEKQMASDGFQSAVTQALFDAVVRFRQHLDEEAQAPTPAPQTPGVEPSAGRTGAVLGRIR